MKKVEVKAAPGRLINAIANMGYDVEVALCDLIDNSIDAKADNIKVYLLDKSSETGRKNTIYRYLIADDGIGMSEDALINAFTLGSIRNYPEHALGKFGIGLKSASLSLANKIIVITKTQKSESPLCGILSREDIEASGKYEIDFGDPPTEYLELWEEYNISNEEQGTLLILDELNEPPYNEFIDYFQRYSSIIYHLFLKESEFSIIINDKQLESFDPLFLEESEKNGALDISEWDGRKPQLLLETQELELDDGTKCEIAVTQLVHPPTFEKEGKRAEIREKYYIDADPYTKRPRHGFYVYRNRRVIVMAELFRGIVSRETSSWAFRGKLMFNENSDKAMSLDVKKRHCHLPPKARTNLKNIIKPYHSKSTNAWREAGGKANEEHKENKEKLANESITNSPVSKTNYIPTGTNIETTEDLEKREKRQEEVSQATLKVIQDESISKEVLEKHAEKNEKVILVKGLKSNAMWEVYPDTKIKEVEVILNKYNTWIEKAYKEAETEERITILLHQLFYILARAELEVRTTDFPGFPTPDKVEKVFEQFRFQAGMMAESLAETLDVELNKLKEEQENYKAE